jgi:toxin secretion/phage lysis holin
MKTTKIATAAVGGYFSAQFGFIVEMILIVGVFIALDYITGLMAGRANEGLNSKRAFRGIAKKCGLLGLFVLGFGLDWAFNQFISNGLDFTLPFRLPFGLVISAWIVITEAISICENIMRLNVPIPSWLIKFLHKSKKETEKAKEEESNGQDIQ